MLPAKFLSLQGLTEADLMEFFGGFGDPLESFVETADFWAGRNVACRGKIGAMIFLQPSLRTRTSFEASLKRMGGNTIEFTSMEQALSDHQVRENIEEAGRFLSQYVDLIVIRSPDGDLPNRLATYTDVPVLSAGHGEEEHPTAALSQLHTIHRHHGRIRDLTTLVVGKMPKRCLNSMVEGLLAAPGQAIHLVTPSPAPRLRRWQQMARESGGTVLIHATLRDALEVVNVKDLDVIVGDETGADYVPPHTKEPAALITEGFLAQARRDLLLLHMKPVLRILSPGLAEQLGPRLALESKKSGLMRAEVMLHLLEPQLHSAPTY